MAENESSNQSYTTINQQGGDNSILVGVNEGIINIVRSVFSSVKQVIAFILTLTAVLALVALGYWASIQPRELEGEFNIAISKFAETTNNTDVDVAESAGRLIFNFLDGEYDLSSFEFVDVEYYDQVTVVSREDAQALMDKTNADIVIFGNVEVINDQAEINPNFYITEQFQFDVLSGRHDWHRPFNFKVQELLDSESEVNTGLVQRMAILTEFTKGLVYYASDDLELSLDAMDSAIRYVEDDDEPFPGSEVIYLLASNNARLQKEYDQSQSYLDEAMNINKNYGRAYIAQGNIYYDQFELYEAILTYQEALTLEGQDPEAYIVEKASLNIGNIYVYQFQETDRNPDALQEEKDRLAQEGLVHYQVVIDSFNDLPRPEPRLQDMAAWSYYGSGIIYQVQGSFDKAANYFKQALALTKDLDLQERANRRLQEVQTGDVL